MNHFKGLLWLLAWSVWFALGVGLYKELPRPFGQPVSSLPVEKFNSWALGFIGDSNEVVVLSRTDRQNGTSPTTVSVVHAETGMVLRSTYGAAHPDGSLGDARQQCHRGVLLAKLSPSPDGSNNARAVFALDLATMEWRMASDRTPDNVALHPTKPLMLIANMSSEGGFLQGGVFLVDYQTSKETYVSSASARGNSFFLDDGRRIAVTNLLAADQFGHRENRIEIWNVEGEPFLERTIDSVVGHIANQSSLDGRVLVIGGTLGTPTLDVFDLIERRFMFADRPTQDGRPTVLTRVGGPALSKSARSLLAGRPPALWNVDTGDLIRQPNPYEDIWPQDSQDVFAVRENWHKLWEQWFPKVKLYSFAYRSLEDSRLIHRTTSQTQIQPKKWNACGTLAVAEDGNVYRLPLPVNWPLLALCQSILALPLVMLWAILRWRRKRRARLATSVE